MSDPTFEALNPDGSDPGAEFTNWTLTQYLDKYWQLEAEAADDVPLLEQGWIDVSENGNIVFRGYLDEIDPSEGGTIRLTYYDLRRSLEEVFAQIMEYPAGTTVNQMLSSDAPAPGVKPGLLWLLNSCVAQGDFIQYSGEIYMLEGAGSSNARCGSGAVYQESTALTLGTGPDSLSRGQYYKTATDLYVRCTDGRDPKYWVMSIANFKDSRIRRGTIELGSYTFTVPYRIKKTNFRDLIDPLLTALGLEMRLEHRAPVADAAMGYSYLHAESIVGKGSSSEPLAFYAESSHPGGALLVKERTTGGSACNSLIGAGPGSGYSQEVAAKSNYASMGHWKERIYSTSLLGEMLTSSLEKIWGDQSDSRCWEVKDEDDLTRIPGDWVEVTPERSQPLVKRVKKAVHRSDGTMTLEINQRRLEPEDEMRARSQVVSDLMSYISNQVTSWSASFGPENVDDNTSAYAEWGGEARFTVNLPAGSIDEEFPYEFYLSFTITPYEETTESDDTKSHGHGGSAGSHSGYGGGSTSNNGGDPHAVQQFTSQSGSAALLCASGSHTHSIAVNSGHSATFSNTSYPVTDSGGDTHGDYACSGVWVSGSHSASCGYPTGTATASDDSHVHPIPQHNTNSAVPHPHTEDTYSAKNRAIFTEPLTATQKTSFKTKLDTGNSPHLLDVSVKLNGVHIPGSPFPSLYIGDSENVGVSSLVNNGDNVIEFGIKDHTNPAVPVRCAVRGSLNAQYYIYPFAQ